MINLNDIKQTILNSENLKELYLAEVELMEHIGTLHKGRMMADTKMEQGEMTAQINVGNSLAAICRERQSEIQEQNKNEANQHNKMNYHFRMAAKLMLKKETYDAIYSEAQKPRQETKEQSKELRKAKIE